MPLYLPSQPKLRILVVDDDEVIRLLMHQFLEGAGYLVDEAANGEEAMAMAMKTGYDLIIMDIALPGADGPTICQSLNSTLENPPPILMVTAMDDETLVDRSFQAGAVDYIHKPIHWSVLKNRIRYILGSHRAKQELALLSSRYEMILDAAANGICGVDEDQLISYINPAALAMLGYEDRNLRGVPYQQVFRISLPGTDEFDLDCCPFFHDPDQLASSHFDEVRMRRRDGTVFPADFRSSPILREGQLSGAVLVFQDVTERLQAAELIRFMANHDSLTNLPNRNYLRKRLPQAISLAKRYNRPLFLLFVDLDRFKPINDTYGHEIGDIVLFQVARRLTKLLRASDSVCRLGGDEFVILLESAADIQGAELVAQKTIESLNRPIEARNHICYVGASIGISAYPQDCQDAETMLRHGDIAMYEAKQMGRNRWQVYSDKQLPVPVSPPDDASAKPV